MGEAVFGVVVVEVHLRGVALEVVSGILLVEVVPPASLPPKLPVDVVPGPPATLDLEDHALQAFLLPSELPHEDILALANPSDVGSPRLVVATLPTDVGSLVIVLQSNVAVLAALVPNVLSLDVVPPGIHSPSVATPRETASGPIRSPVALGCVGGT